ncbi:uncharacterized protein [Physcomitrium patens]|uniref:J domain-containing protein n=1 Tax=Physcomitrium patens TaxID=3218 RepID=A0A7I4CYW1_PHYPA|nr:uncharacterized protein LOC112277416 isoform X2 [Physcomitrium patens]|eukprot:XP_024365436.1 uncharacterized protein LOC112277416 isoform X2 [Physcomitrella patens]
MEKSRRAHVFNTDFRLLLRIRGLSSSGKVNGVLSLLRKGIGGGISGRHSECGCCKARRELRFGSLSDSIDIKSWASIQVQGPRRPSNISRRWYFHKLRVRCDARREDDRGRQVVVDHYKVLGLRRQATASAIKLAYRQLARQFHPDVNKDADANEKFMSVRHAYEVLSDEASRKLYDSTLQEQVNISRRKQVYQRRERDIWTRTNHNRSQYRRGSYGNAEWGYSMNSYENEHSNMESYYYTYPSSSAFGTKKKKPFRYPSRGTSQEEEIKNQDSQVEWQSMGKEFLLFLWVVSAMWHALGAQIALGLLLGFLVLWKDFAVGYKLASGVACLMGGEKGLALMVVLIVSTRIFGRAYHTVAIILSLALWLGGGALKTVSLPHGAILLLVYKCIQLQRSGSTL